LIWQQQLGLLDSRFEVQHHPSHPPYRAERYKLGNISQAFTYSTSTNPKPPAPSKHPTTAPSPANMSSESTQVDEDLANAYQEPVSSEDTSPTQPHDEVAQRGLTTSNEEAEGPEFHVETGPDDTGEHSRQY
jgi:hypothetical protein